jgi:uncharacterized protein YqgC (DUF456 family)
LSEQVKRRSFLVYAGWGAVIDLIVFVGSFVFSGGAHGPAGPTIVLGVLNAPVRELVVRNWPPEARTNTTTLVLAFLVVLVNGAVYGLVFGLLSRLWHFFDWPRTSDR